MATVNEFIEELQALGMGDAEILLFNSDFWYCEPEFGAVSRQVVHVIKYINQRIPHTELLDTANRRPMANFKPREAVVVMRRIDQEIE